MICRAQPVNDADGAIWSRRYDSSRCVCALTSPGMTATSPSSTPGVGSLPARRPSATMRPRSTVNQPPYIGSPSIGTSQAAWYRIIKWEDQIEWQSCRMAEWQNLKSVQSILQSCNSAILQFVLHVIPLFLARPTARGIEAQLLGDVRVASFPRAGQ